jgi:hypothetical protein
MNTTTPITTNTTTTNNRRLKLQLPGAALPSKEKDEFVFDIVENMCRQESVTYQRLQSSYFSSSNDDVDVDVLDYWRTMLIEWMYQVVDFSHVKRETIGVAVYLFDICIDQVIQDKTCKTSFQLAAATSMQLAVKTHDCKVIKHKDLTILGRGMFTERDVTDMELQIIQACNWYLHPPSTYCFLNQYMKLMHISTDTKNRIYQIAMIITELLISEKQYKAYPPSIAAYASMLLAMAFIDPSSISTAARRYFCDSISSRIIRSEESSEMLIQVIQDLQESLEKSSSSHQLDCLGLLDSTTLRILTAETAKGTSDVYNTTSPESPIAVPEARWRITPRSPR